MKGVVVERYILRTALLGICFGIFVYEFFSIGLYAVLFSLLILTASVLLSFIVKMEILARPLLVLLCVFLLAIVFGVARSAHSEKEFVLAGYEGETLTLYGEVVREPETRESYLSLVVDTEIIETDSECRIVSEKVLVKADRFLNATYGDEVRVSGSIDIPKPFITETGRTFSYDEYLKKDGVGSIVSFATVEVVSRGGGNWIVRTLLDIKQTYLSVIVRYIPDPEASLLGGLTVGTEQSLGEELENDFRRTGIIHIVVLSGYNIIIIAEMIQRTLRFLPSRVRLIVSGSSIALFVVLVGASATVVRASIMAVTALVARSAGREALGLQMLFFAGIVMLVSNPSLLLYDPSFQLSFIATLGLILLSKPLEHLFVWMRSRTLGEITTATIATQIAVLPLLIFSFGEVSLVALPVNLLVLPTVPLAMLLGFLTGVAGVLPLVSVLLAPVLGALAFLVLSFELLIVDLFARIPLASVSVPPLSLATVLLLYALLGFALWKMRDSGYTERAA